MYKNLIGKSNNEGTLTQKKLTLMSRRNFLKKTGQMAGAVTAYAILNACPGNDTVTPDAPSKGFIKILDYDGAPLENAVIQTDKGNYNSGDLVEATNNTYATIIASGFVTRKTSVGNKDCIMVPSSEEAFYADFQIAKDGTHRFNDQVKVYIKGDSNSSDYQRAQSRFSVIAADTVPHSFVNSESEANYVIHLNADSTVHGETISAGVITRADINLEQGVSYEAIDEEIAQGLCHVENSVAKPTTGSSCIGGSLGGWNESVDRPILRAFYNRNNSKFDGNGTETERL